MPASQETEADTIGRRSSYFLGLSFSMRASSRSRARSIFAERRSPLATLLMYDGSIRNCFATRPYSPRNNLCHSSRVIAGGRAISPIISTGHLPTCSPEVGRRFVGETLLAFTREFLIPKLHARSKPWNRAQLWWYGVIGRTFPRAKRPDRDRRRGYRFAVEFPPVLTCARAIRPS